MLNIGYYFTTVKQVCQYGRLIFVDLHKNSELAHINFGGDVSIMKNRLVILLFSAMIFAVICAAALLTRGWLCAVIILSAVTAWIIFLVRFILLKYNISDAEITITGGLFFKHTITIKRSAILSQSRLYLSDHLICTIVRTAGKTAVLFCDIP